MFLWNTKYLYLRRRYKLEMSFTTAHSPGNHVNLSSLCFATIQNWETLQTWTCKKYFCLWLIITAYSFWGCWHVLRGECVPSWQFLPLLVWSLVLMSGHGNLGYGEPLQWPVINYAILSPYDIFIAHLYLIRGQDGGADGDIVLMAIYSESYVI